MMNVKFLTQLLFSDAAVLTSVIVALARSTALFEPIGTVVFNTFTLVIGVIFTSLVFGHPLSIAIRATEGMLNQVSIIWKSSNHFPTHYAPSFNSSFPQWMVFTSIVFRLPFSRAISTAKNLIILGWFYLEQLTALFADFGNSIFRQILPTKYIALAGTEPSVFCGGINLKGTSTHLALFHNLVNAPKGIHAITRTILGYVCAVIVTFKFFPAMTTAFFDHCIYLLKSGDPRRQMASCPRAPSLWGPCKTKSPLNGLALGQSNYSTI